MVSHGGPIVPIESISSVSYSVLREYAGLDKEVILAGASKKIEIWNKDRYLADQKEYEDNIDEIAANMEKFGFSI